MTRIGRTSSYPPPLNLTVGPFGSGAYGGTLGVPSANRAYLSPFQVTRPVTITQAVMYFGVASGRVDVGIYSDTGVLLASSGSTSVTATAGVQTIALTAAVTLVPGVRYWSAVVANNNTLTFERLANNPTITAYGQYYASAFPLADLTFPGTASGSHVRLFWS